MQRANSLNSAMTTRRIGPRERLFVIRIPEVAVAAQFDGQDWRSRWFRTVGTMGLGEGLLKLLFTSARLRQANVLINELSAVPGAVGAVIGAHRAVIEQFESRYQAVQS